MDLPFCGYLVSQIVAQLIQDKHHKQLYNICYTSYLIHYILYAVYTTYFLTLGINIGTAMCG